jgi:hypothetical protein
MSHQMVRRCGFLCAAPLAAVLLVLGCGTHSNAPTAPHQNSLSSSMEPAPPSPQTSTTRLTVGGLPDPMQLAITVQEKYSAVLMAIPGVVGTGATLDALDRGVVEVLVQSAGVPGVPTLLDGVKVEKVVTGTLGPWASELAGSFRPVPIGVSVGNADFAHGCVPGTITCIVERENPERHYFLSANHVFARQNQAAIGDPIIQPSQPDNLPNPCGPNYTSAIVAHLAEFVPVVYDGHTENTMDAAIAEVDPSVSTSCGTPPGYSGYYAFPGPALATNDEPGRGQDPRPAIMKIGRTTGLTRGSLKAVNVKVKITSAAGTALFVNQYLTTTNFGDVGDSGALVVIDSPYKWSLGMIIGGGSGGAAIVSPMTGILRQLGVRICNY